MGEIVLKGVSEVQRGELMGRWNNGGFRPEPFQLEMTDGTTYGFDASIVQLTDSIDGETTVTIQPTQ